MGNQGVMGLHSQCYLGDQNLNENKNHHDSVQYKKLVKIKGVSTTYEVPCDQKSPLCVRNIYSPIAYGIRRKQRALEARRKLRTREILEQCSNLFDSGENNFNYRCRNKNLLSISGTFSENKHPNQISFNRYREDSSAVAVFVMSVHPSFPASKRPTIQPNVRQALVDLFSGTDLCFLSDVDGETMVCTAVLQLTKGVDIHEGSIVIYKGYDRSFVHSYVPLSSVSTISRGLEPDEKEYYAKSGEILSCKTTSEEIFQVDLKRAFTLHYYLPTDFYASFVAFSDKDMQKWIDAISYFTFVNEAFNDYTS
ncbi:unnamed protein product [Phytomonas sp. Hart1]|nr:unnamed protein product [Phytomonas sp. Hart1]|eukprot:CCW68059.1 unnamed protein product [Phytomonas sp. isolate Hart1]